MKIPFDPLKLIPLVSWACRLWMRSLRYEVHGDLRNLREGSSDGPPLVVAFWHAEIFSVLGLANRISNRFLAVVSQSKDGEFAARLVESLGQSTVRGSSSKGGLRVLLQLKRIMARENKIGAFAVDGPRGPRHKPKDGIIFLAQRAKAKIIPARAYPRWKKVFNSWDLFTLPLPFSKCDLYLGEPMDVTDEKLDADVLSRERKRLADRLNSLGKGS